MISEKEYVLLVFAAIAVWQLKLFKHTTCGRPTVFMILYILILTISCEITGLCVMDVFSNYKI